MILGMFLPPLKMIFTVIITTTIITTPARGKFIIERNERGSDRLINIDGLDKVDRDMTTFKADGTCLDARRNIASSITEPTTRCYTNTEMKYIGNGKPTQPTHDFVATLKQRLKNVMCRLLGKYIFF